MKVEGFDKLIRSAQSGEHQAMEALLADIRPYLAKVATGYTDPSRASESVSDLMQESELRVWQNLRQFQGGCTDEETHAMFRTWLCQIIRRIAYDRTKAKNRQKRKAPGARIRSLDASSVFSPDGAPGRVSEPPSSGATPSANLREAEVLTRLHRAIDEVLDAPDREIVRLYFFEQLSLPRIAETLGWTYDRVRDRYRRSIQQLEQHLGS